MCICLCAVSARGTAADTVPAECEKSLQSVPFLRYHGRVFREFFSHHAGGIGVEIENTGQMVAAQTKISPHLLDLFRALILVLMTFEAPSSSNPAPSACQKLKFAE